MKQFDRKTLSGLGITLPETDMEALCRLLTETLELRVGEQMSRRLSDDLMDEFDRVIDAGDDDAVAQWLEEYLPEYSAIIDGECQRLLQEVRDNALAVMEAVPPHFSASEIRKGQELTFGRWPADHPLRWTVLDADRAGRTALLLCTEAIELEEFQPGDKDPGWPKSHMRAWLNGTFLFSAFRERERRCICKCALSTLGDEKSLRHSDSVFLLSKPEVEIYLKAKTSRCVPASQHAEEQGVSIYGEQKRCYWWMRSGSSQRACAVTDGGSMVSTRGALSDYAGVGLRPAVRIRMQR